MSRRKLTLESYLVGWICPLEVEQTAAMEMLDEEHESLPTSSRDNNVYHLGSINGHNVVIAGLPQACNNSAATVITQMRMTFPNLQYGLLVGIGGGVPVRTDEGPVRLGHVVVSKPTGQHSGAIQYDHGKAMAGKFERTGCLQRAPTALLNAAQALAVARLRADVDPVWQNTRRIATHRRRLRRFAFPGAANDHLYRSSYIHPVAGVTCEAAGCRPDQLISWAEGEEDEEEDDPFIIVHRGNIASGEWVIKDAVQRDHLAHGEGLLCFEQEAAGALTDFPCLVVRGISDYCDSHKSNLWQGFAAAAAAAYARQLFFHMPIELESSAALTVRSKLRSMGEVQSCSETDKELLDICRKQLGPRDLDDYFDEIQTFDGSASLSRHHVYRAWNGAASDTPALLELVGKPDTGKTVLMKGAVLAENADPETITIYHFFYKSWNNNDFIAPVRSKYSLFLRSLLGQLISKVSRLPWDNIRSWGRELQSNGDAGLWSNDRLQKAITQVILDNGNSAESKPVRFRIFIDAINESLDDVSTNFTPNPLLAILLFASDLAAVATSSGVDLRICISREHVPQFGKREPKASIIQVDKCMNSTVDRYIQEQLKKLEDDGLAFRLYLRLRQKLGDGILWATVVTQGILEMYGTATLGEMEKFAEEVTQDVDTVYESILKSAKPSDHHMLHFFTIALGALRPLSADQFRHALAFTEEFECEDIEAWENSAQGLKPGKMFENRLRHETRGLMEVVVRNSGEPDQIVTDQVRFANSAFERFLRNKNGLSLLGKDDTVSLEQRCHLSLFQICTRVLDLCQLRGEDKVKFLDYACEFWLRHAQGSQDLVAAKELPQFMRKCKAKKTLRVIQETIKALTLSQAKEAHLLENQNSMLVLLSTMGCTSLLRQHLQSCMVCEEACKSQASDPTQYRTALMNSIIGRHPDTASFLLEIRAQGDINELFDHTTPLYDASYFASSGNTRDQAQRLDLVRFLISRGADPAVHSMMGYEYPLHAAIALGNKLLIKELLKSSTAKAEQLMKLQRKRKGWTALHFALESGRAHRDRLSVLRTLLDSAPKGVGLLGLLDNDGNTPMMLAEKMGGSEGEDFVEAFEDFEMEEEEAALRDAREQRSSSAPAQSIFAPPKPSFKKSEGITGPEGERTFPFPRRRRTR